MFFFCVKTNIYRTASFTNFNKRDPDTDLLDNRIKF